MESPEKGSKMKISIENPSFMVILTTSGYFIQATKSINPCLAKRVLNYSWKRYFYRA